MLQAMSALFMLRCQRLLPSPPVLAWKLVASRSAPDQPHRKATGENAWSAGLRTARGEIGTCAHSGSAESASVQVAPTLATRMASTLTGQTTQQQTGHIELTSGTR